MLAMAAIPHDGTARIAPRPLAGTATPADEASLEKLRLAGDLDGQRRHLWQVLGELTNAPSPAGLPPFMAWHGAEETFASSAAAAGGPGLPLRLFAVDKQNAKRGELSNSPPLIVVTHYNTAAYRHIRANALQQRDALDALGRRSTNGNEAAAVNEVPAFPRAAMVLKSAWWPVPDDGAVAMPVWDPEQNVAAASGNDYPSWKRMVAVCPSGFRQPMADVGLLGRSSHLECVGVDRFFHLTLDAPMAAQLMQDPTARKLAAMVVGRNLRAGDHLALVALHVATRELPDWVWGTVWWHDRPGQGPYAAGRPADQAAPWRNYLMNVAFDAERPREPDGSARIVFNPWLEARFPDSGHGGGTVSNCLSCHRRAGFPAVGAFTVTRGTPPVAMAADEPDAVKTSSLWSLPLQAR